MEKILINIGCGFNTGGSWINYDASPTLFFERIPIIGNLYTKNKSRFPRIARFGDILKGPLCEENSADAVFCSHMLEHLALIEMRESLKNIHNMLRAHGCFRLIVPDLECLVKEYCGSESENRAHVFIEQTGMGAKEPDRTFFAKFKKVFGHARHCWLYDERSLCSELQRSGFKNISRCQFGDSDIIEFSEVEDEARFEKALAIECFK